MHNYASKNNNILLAYKIKIYGYEAKFIWNTLTHHQSLSNCLKKQKSKMHTHIYSKRNKIRIHSYCEKN